MEIQSAIITATVETHVSDGGLSLSLESVFSSIDTILSIINIFMTAIAIAVALVGILGIWGYQSIKDASKNFAEKRIKELLSAEQISDKIRSELEKIAKKESNQLWEDLQMAMFHQKSDGVPSYNEKKQGENK